MKPSTRRDPCQLMDAAEYCGKASVRNQTLQFHGSR